MTKYQHSARRTNGEKCYDESGEPCGWCLLETCTALGEAVLRLNEKVLALGQSRDNLAPIIAEFGNRLDTQSRLLDALNVHVRTLEKRLAAHVRGEEEDPEPIELSPYRYTPDEIRKYNERNRILPEIVFEAQLAGNVLCDVPHPNKAFLHCNKDKHHEGDHGNSGCEGSW